MKPWLRSSATAAVRAAFWALVGPLGLVAFFLTAFFLAFALTGVAVGAAAIADSSLPRVGQDHQRDRDADAEERGRREQPGDPPRPARRAPAMRQPAAVALRLDLARARVHPRGIVADAPRARQ